MIRILPRTRSRSGWVSTLGPSKPISLASSGRGSCDASNGTSRTKATTRTATISPALFRNSTPLRQILRRSPINTSYAASASKRLRRDGEVKRTRASLFVCEFPYAINQQKNLTMVQLPLASGQRRVNTFSLPEPNERPQGHNDERDSNPHGRDTTVPFEGF
jgi:hypothetical protein